MSTTTQRRSRLQHGYCIGVSRRCAQATVSKGLAQGLYMAARAGVEPTTLRLKAIDSTKAPPCPTGGDQIHVGSSSRIHNSLATAFINSCHLFERTSTHLAKEDIPSCCLLLNL